MPTRRKKKPAPPPSMRPFACVILAIDPGADSGAALFDHGQLMEWGAVDSLGKMQAAAQKAYDHAEFVGAPLVVVIESHSVWLGWGARQREAVIENVGLWKHAVSKLPNRTPTTKIVRVNVMTWRSKVLGKTKGIAKQEMIGWVHMLFKKQTFIKVDHNTAEAILIGRWATMAGEVGELPGVKAT